MKRLFLLRHAKSSWDDPSLDDLDRPLNDRGMRSAPFMGEVIAERSFVPDLILTSPARRAAQTASLVKESAGLQCPMTSDERIYEAGPPKLCQIISELDDILTSVMLVGHNPSMEGLVKYLTDRFESMPTASLAVIDLDIKSWKDTAPTTGILVELIRPKEIRSD